MERALGQFLLDVHTSEHGYTEIAPPLLVRDEVMFGTAQLPKFEDDQFPNCRRMTVEARCLKGSRACAIELTKDGEFCDR